MSRNICDNNDDMPAGSEFDDQIAADAAYDAQFDADDDDAAIESRVPNAAGALAAGAPMGKSVSLAAVTPAPAAAGSLPLEAAVNQLLLAQQDANSLLAHLVSMQTGAHERTLKTLANGANVVTRELHLSCRGSLKQFSENPGAARFIVPEGALPHTHGTLLDVTVVRASSAFPASLMMQASGIKTLAEPTVVSASNVKGVCVIPAKSKDIPRTPIISAVESDAHRKFTELFGEYTVDTLEADLTKLHVKDPTTGVKSVMVNMPADHPVTNFLRAKLDEKKVAYSESWNPKTNSFTFAQAEVNVALAELKHKLMKENSAVSLDKLSFPLVRAEFSPALVKSKAATKERDTWLDTTEIATHIKAGTPANELEKQFHVNAVFSITYAPSPNSLRKVEAN